MNAKQDSAAFEAYRGLRPTVRRATPLVLDVASPESIPDLAEDLQR